MTADKAVAFLLLGVLNFYLGLWFLGYAAYWFLYVIDQVRLTQNPVEMHPISRPHDDGRPRQTGSGATLQGFFDRAVVDVGPKDADDADLPTQVESPFRSAPWADAEEQIRPVLLGRLQQ